MSHWSTEDQKNLWRQDFVWRYYCVKPIVHFQSQWLGIWVLIGFKCRVSKIFSDNHSVHQTSKRHFESSLIMSSIRGKGIWCTYEVRALVYLGLRGSEARLKRGTSDDVIIFSQPW